MFKPFSLSMYTSLSGEEDALSLFFFWTCPSKKLAHPLICVGGMCGVCCINQQQGIELSYFHSAKSWKLPGCACGISAVDVLEEHWKERQVTSVTELIFFTVKKRQNGKGWKRPTQGFFILWQKKGWVHFEKMCRHVLVNNFYILVIKKVTVAALLI